MNKIFNQIPKFLGKIQSFNDNKYLSGMALLLLNLGSKYLSFEVSRSQEELMAHIVFRRFILFTVFFVGTRDILVSFILEENYIDYQEFIVLDINFDGSINILDVVVVINILVGGLP